MLAAFSSAGIKTNTNVKQANSRCLWIREANRACAGGLTKATPWRALGFCPAQADWLKGDQNGGLFQSTLTKLSGFLTIFIFARFSDKIHPL